MAFKKGNKEHEKLNTPELRALAYKDYCDWLALGKSKRIWRLKKPVRITWETMERSMRTYPDEFDLEEIRYAIAEGRAKWEQLLEDHAEGKNKDANFFSLRMVLQNKYRMGYPDRHEDDDDLVTAKYATESMMSQLEEVRLAMSTRPNAK